MPAIPVGAPASSKPRWNRSPGSSSRRCPRSSSPTTRRRSGATYWRAREAATRSSPACPRIPRSTDPVEPRELKPGLWRWMARHPDWRAEEGGESGWQPDVACHAWTAPDALVLFDPLLTTGAAWRWLDGLVERQEGPLVVAITVQWHHRSGAEVAQRYGNSRPVEIWAHTAGAKPWPCPITREFAGDAELPGGVRALAVDPVRAEVVYWIEPARTLVAGDALLG